MCLKKDFYQIRNDYFKQASHSSKSQPCPPKATSTSVQADGGIQVDIV